jgi:hypothetical protein
MVCNQPDEDIFCEQCAALERNIPGLLKGKSLEDPSGYSGQSYSLNGNDILVENDYDVGGVFVRSDIDLLS